MKPLRIGLALGSGAARGWAHIGVIRALETMGITPDIVTGTSIGSLVGGAYAAGKLDELEDWVRTMDRWTVIDLLDIGIADGGVIAGKKVFTQAQKRFGKIDIRALPIDYAAVATELTTGKEIWLCEGDLFSVARASCAMPGLLSPQFMDGRWLVDGALANPVPVSLARSLQADFVIAVHLNSQIQLLEDEVQQNAHSQPPGRTSSATLSESRLIDGKEQTVFNERDQGMFHHVLSRSQNFIEQLRGKLGKGARTPGVFGVMASAIDIMQERITKASFSTNPPDILLQPKLGRLGLLEFDQGADAIRIGYETTMRAQQDILQKLKDVREQKERV